LLTVGLGVGLGELIDARRKLMRAVEVVTVGSGVGDAVGAGLWLIRFEIVAESVVAPLTR
jgi:hypothetical protein